MDKNGHRAKLGENPADLFRCILGTAGLGGVWGKVEPEESVRAVLLALEHGITAIDTAPAYGDAEAFVGEALRRWEGPTPAISTKAGRLKSYVSEECYYDYSSEGLERSLANSLKVLGVPAVDILFLHEPAALPQNEAERVIEALLAFRGMGYAHKIGVGGNSPSWFRKYITNGIFDVVMEYNRLNACCLEAATDTLPECESKEIAFYAASPLYMGLLGGRMASFMNAPPTWLEPKYVDMAREINEIAKMHRISVPSLSHRFLLSLPYNFQIVIGPSDSTQLLNTMVDFSEGPLDAEVFTQVMDHLNKQGK